MPNVDELVVRAVLKDELSKGLVGIKAELEGVSRGLEKVASSRNQRSVDNLTGRFSGFEKQLKSLNRQFASLSGSADRFALHAVRNGALGLGVMSVAAVGFGLKAAASFQQSEIAFGTLLGSVAKGQALFGQLQQFNLETPFNLTQVAGATQTLLQFGFTGDNVMKTLKGISDVAATSGPQAGDNLGRIALALGQIRSAGVLRAQDLNQLVQAGFPAYQVLTDITGQTTAEIRKQMETGLEIPAQKFIEHINNETGALGRYGAGAAAQAGTLSGQLSNFTDKVQVRLAKAMEPLAKSATTYLPALTDEVGKLIDKTAPQLAQFTMQLANALIKELPAAGDALSKMFTELGPLLPKVLDAGISFIGILPELTRDFVALVTPVVHLFDAISQHHVLAETLLGTLLAYKAVSGVTSTIYGLAGAFRSLAIAQGAAATTGGAGGVGGALGALGKAALPVAGGLAVGDSLMHKESWARDAETVGGFAAGGTLLGALGGPFAPITAPVGAAIGGGVGLGVVAARRLRGGGSDSAPPADPWGVGQASLTTLLAPGAVVVNNPGANVDVEAAVQRALEENQRRQVRRGGDRFGG